VDLNSLEWHIKEVILHGGGMLSSLDPPFVIFMGCLPLLGEYCTCGTFLLVFYVLFDLSSIVSWNTSLM
jgi:hypothetical protein